MADLHFANLSRGLLCEHLGDVAITDIRYCRIQSTSCEQKRWGDVIAGAGPELLMAMAQGMQIHVHDVSERNRETRAMWQGLAFLRRACETLWHLEPTPVVGRGGLLMQDYFDHAIRNLSTHDRRQIRHFRSHVDTTRIHVVSCWRTAHPVRRPAVLEAA